MRHLYFSAVFHFHLLLNTVTALYLPGVAPTDYAPNDIVPLMVNALSSSSSALPYDYYHESLQFCTPKKLEAQAESLGSILFGDRIFNSPFEVTFIERR
jgi:transmembrane 9 superfamily protein 2/4